MSKELQVSGAVISWTEKLRAAMFNGVKESDIQEIVQNIVAKAKQGDEKATRFVFDYILGAKAPQQKLVQNNYYEGGKPDEPTSARKGTPEKLAVMRKRASQGRALHHKDDA